MYKTLEKPRQPTKDCLFCGRAINVSCHICPHCGRSLAKREQLNWERRVPADVSSKRPAKITAVDWYRAGLVFCLFVTLTLMVLILIPRHNPELVAEATAVNPPHDSVDGRSEPVDFRRRSDQHFFLPEYAPYLASDSPQYAFVDIADRFTPVAGTTESLESKDPEEDDARRRRIEYLTAEIQEDLKKEDAVAADTLFLKSGEPIGCAILAETPSYYRISRKGVTTMFPKEKVVRVERRSGESVEAELRRMALAIATDIVDNGLVHYGDEWITPEESVLRVEKAKKRLEAQKRDAQEKIEVARAQAKAKLKPDNRTEVPVLGSCRFTCVTVTFTGNGSSVEATMLLDTGSSMTCIHPCIAKSLGLEYTGEVQIMLADGRVIDYPSVSLEEVSIQGMAVHELEAFVAPYGTPGTHGLIGSDFLNHFEYGFDPVKGTLILKSLE